jgi:hypothetical protein
MNRSCQRQTLGFDTPAGRITAAVPQPSAVTRTIRARQTCLCGLFRSATIASSRARSAAVTSISIPLPIATAYYRHHTKGTFCQTLSASAWWAYVVSWATSEI